MDTYSGLAELKAGESAIVTQVGGEESMGRRLMDLGLIPGTRVTCLGASPAGDPSAYLIRGAVFALRRKDANTVRIRPLSREQDKKDRS